MATEAKPETERKLTPSAGLEVIKRNPWVKLAMVVLPPVLASLLAYTGAGELTREKSEGVKQAAEAGFQVTLDTLRALRDETRRLEMRLARLDAEVTAVKRAIRKNAPAIKVAAPPPVIQAPAPAPPLPPDLDAALRAKSPTPAP